MTNPIKPSLNLDPRLPGLLASIIEAQWKRFKESRVTDWKIDAAHISSVENQLEGVIELLYPATKSREAFLCRGEQIMMGSGVEVRCPAHGTTFKFGVHARHIYLSLELDRADLLVSMKDEFWAEIAILGMRGNAVFNEFKPMDGSESKEDRGLLKHRKSLVFELIRGSIFLTQAKDDFMDFGRLELTWDLQGPLDETIEGLAVGLCQLYRIGYLVHRADYLRRYGKRQRQGTRSSRVQ